jgi:chemotaxis regulatin CheY-phosphate phosphatase CheZ
MSASTVCKAEPTGEQESYRIDAAQDILKQLQLVFQEGELPGPEAINDALVKAEQFLVKHTQNVKFKTDPQTLRVLEDIALLIGSVKNMASHKNLAERLQLISEETKKALEEAAKSGASAPTIKATNEAIALMDTWRPLFQLLVTSREFRDLCVDLIKIMGRVLRRHHEGLGKEAEQKFLEGQPPKEIVKDIAESSKESFQTPQGEVQVQISEEEFDQLYDDIARILKNLSQHSTYHDGIQRFFNLLDLWHGQLKETRKDIKANAAPHARRAQLETE